MKVLLISTNTNSSLMPVIPAGICMIAEAVEKAGHKAEVIDLMFSGHPDGAIETAMRGFRPDIIGLSLRNIDNNVMKKPQTYVAGVQTIVKTIRQRTRVPIVLGGAAAGVMPRELLQETGVDVCVAGPGETVFPRLLEKYSRSKSIDVLTDIAGRERILSSIGDDGLRYGDSNLVPDYRRWLSMGAYRRSLAAIPLRTKLGCPFPCVYCTYGAVEGRAYSLVAPERVADAVQRLIRSGFCDVEFVDSVFNSPVEHARGICEAIVRNGTSARLQSMDMSPRFIDDDLMTLMEKAGFVGMGLTIESASDRVLSGLRKPFGTEDVMRAAEIVRRHRIPCAWIFLLGGPGETEETAAETIHFAERYIRPDDVAFINIGIRIYPGTEIESIARNEGILSVPRERMLEPVFYCSPAVPRERLEQMVKRAVQSNLNFIDPDAGSFPCMQQLYRIGGAVGMRPPLWRHARHIRRVTRFLGA